MDKVIALVVAAGSGVRAGGGAPKQYRLLGGKPMVRRACEALLAHPRVEGVRVVIGEGQQPQAAEALAGLDVGAYIIGGRERALSVIKGLEALPAETARVLIHDAARPFCPAAIIDRLIDALDEFDGAVPVLTVPDTLATLTPERTLGERVDRDRVARVQTPQAFRLRTLVRAYQDWRAAPPSDEAAYLRTMHIPVAAVEGDPRLEKITVAADFDRAEAMLAARLISRTGLGFDVHAFAGPGPLIIGGIRIPHDRGLTGHSDADVALHALTDALLGAAADGDIGAHFPPSDERWGGAASHLFLKHARDLIAARGGVIDHVDVTIICEAPKIGPHREAMRDAVAAMLRLPKARVSVKATTTERLGFTGRGEGIAAQAVATVRMEA